MKVASFYRFLDLDNTESFRDDLQALCDEPYAGGKNRSSGFSIGWSSASRLIRR